MTVYVIAGAPGVGKTSQIFSIADVYRPTRWAAFEAKDRKFFKSFVKNSSSGQMFDWEIMVETYPKGHMDFFGEIDEYMIDPVGTLERFERWVHNTLLESPRTIVVDSISEIRDFAVSEWIYRDNVRRTDNCMSPRQTIGEENLAAWGDVNIRVKRLIIPLIQYAYDTGSDVYFTGQMRDRYVDKVMVGETINIKPWIEHEAEVVIILKKDVDPERIDTDRYWAHCKKIPAWAHNKESKFSIEIRKNDGLLEIFSLHGFLNQ